MWKIADLHLYVRFYAPYEGGWTRTTAALNARYRQVHRQSPTGPTAERYDLARRYTAPMHFDSPARADGYRLAPDDTATAAPPAAGAPRTVDAARGAGARAGAEAQAPARGLGRGEPREHLRLLRRHVHAGRHLGAVHREFHARDPGPRRVHRQRPHLRIHAPPRCAHRRHACSRTCSCSP